MYSEPPEPPEWVIDLEQIIWNFEVWYHLLEYALVYDLKRVKTAKMLAETIKLLKELQQLRESKENEKDN